MVGGNKPPSELWFPNKNHTEMYSLGTWDSPASGPNPASGAAYSGSGPFGVSALFRLQLCFLLSLACLFVCSFYDFEMGIGEAG